MEAPKGVVITGAAGGVGYASAQRRALGTRGCIVTHAHWLLYHFHDALDMCTWWRSALRFENVSPLNSAGVALGALLVVEAQN